MFRFVLKLSKLKRVAIPWILAASAFGWLLLSHLVEASITTKLIAPGVTLTEEVDSYPPLIIHELTVDLSIPSVHIEVIPALDSVTGPTGDIHQGREQVRSIAARHGAVAAVNGDFFPLTGDPYGTAVWNGNLYSEPYPGRAVMGVESDGKTVLFNTLSFLGELQTQEKQMFEITGVDRMVSATDINDLVVFTPTFGPKSGLRPGCDEVVLRGVNLPLRPSKLVIGTITSVNINSQTGSSIPSDGVILAALPGGPAASFLTNNLHVGEKAEFVCAIAPQTSLNDAVRLSFLPRDNNDLPIEVNTTSDPQAYEWATVSEVVGGGPHLITNGNIDVDGTQEGFTDSFVNGLNPRTAIGETVDGKLILVTVDGRQAMSKGLSLSDLAKLMQRLGAYNAINLDGGGSTTMTVEGLIVNSLAGAGYERQVANAVCVFSGDANSVTSASPEPPASPTSVPAPVLGRPTLQPTILGVPESLPAGQSAQLSLAIGPAVVPGDSPSIIWGGSVGVGVAFINQTGQLTALVPGNGNVTAYYDGQVLQQPIVITPGSQPTGQSLISGNLSINQSTEPNFNTLAIGVFASTGMPVANCKIHIDVTGGKCNPTDVMTNIDGYADAEIVWKGKSGSVELTSNGLEPKIVSQTGN